VLFNIHFLIFVITYKGTKEQGNKRIREQGACCWQLFEKGLTEEEGKINLN
jgi:hypothetical protein